MNDETESMDIEDRIDKLEEQMKELLELELDETLVGIKDEAETLEDRIDTLESEVNDMETTLEANLEQYVDGSISEMKEDVASELGDVIADHVRSTIAFSLRWWRAIFRRNKNG